MRRLIIALIICSLGTLLTLTGHTQSQGKLPQTTSPESTKSEALKSAQRQDNTWNLQKFFEMDNPRDAAKALNDHLQKYGISPDARDSSEATQDTNTPSKKILSEATKPLVHAFNGVEFVPAPGVETALTRRANRLTADAKSEERIVCILQTQGEITMRDVIELLDADVKVYEPTGRKALIVRLPASSLSFLTSRPYVRWIGEYKPEYKYAPIPSQSRKAGAFIYPLGGDRPEYRADLTNLGVPIRSYDTSARFYEVVLDASRFKELAEKLWWVKGIAKEPEDTLHGLNYEPDDSRELIGAFITSYTGAGSRIGVRDSGIWPGNSLDFPSGSFISLGGWSDSVGHGTHVSGIIAARGGRNIEGFYDAKGVAPAANIYMVSGVGGSGGNYSFSTAFQFFSDNQVQISNHSWGYTNNYDYDSNTATIDGYADNRDMVIVFSAGNNYDAYTIGNPGTGKDVITVGAVNYVTAGTDEIGRRAVYSSQGPTTEDSRLKPDLVASGGGDSYEQGVVSTNSNPWNFGGSLHGNVDGAYTFPEWPTNDYYLRLSGTSMAAPHVTGVCAKMKEWKADFHSELFKALLIDTTLPIKDNSTDALAGYATTQAGYGLVNALSVTSYYPGEEELLLLGEGYVTEQSKTQDWSITVPAGAQKLSVTFAYNDEEGELSNGIAIKDDLDLYLISPGGTQYIAYQHKAAGVVGESPLEKMVITNPSSGTWTIRIKFFNSPGFGDPFVFAEQVYGVVAHAIYKTPALSLSVPQTTINVTPGQSFTVQPTITNTGGYVAAGITARINGSSSFGGNINQSLYVGNLSYQNAAISPAINLVAPSSSGTYTLTVMADGINKGFDNSSYPKTAQITVNVQQPAGLSINNVTPKAGRVSGGQQIKLSGSFTNLSTVTVGGVSASWSYSNGTIEITVTTPPHAAGAVSIVLTPTSGSTLTKSNAFAYLPTVFTDNTLVAGVTMSKAQHVIELRQAVDALRAVAGLAPATWTDASLVSTSTIIKAVHIQELRSYLEQAAGLLGYPSQSYTDPSLTVGNLIKRLHIEELRQRLRNIAG